MATGDADGIRGNSWLCNYIFGRFSCKAYLFPNLRSGVMPSFPIRYVTLIDVCRKLRRKENGVAIANDQWFDPALWLEWKDKVAATQHLLRPRSRAKPRAGCNPPGNALGICSAE